MSNLHGYDNYNHNKDNKYGKVRHLYDTLNQSFLKNSPHDEHHSVDESKVPYFGRHSLKQFIRGKPIRHDYKIMGLMPLQKATLFGNIPTKEWLRQ